MWAFVFCFTPTPNKSHPRDLRDTARPVIGSLNGSFNYYVDILAVIKYVVSNCGK